MRLRLGIAAIVGITVLLLPAGASGDPISIDPVIRGTAGANGWYTSDVTVNWSFSPLPTKTVGCEAVTITTPGQSLDCQAWWGPGGTPPFSDYPLTISVDKTPPTVQGVPARVPDSNGWYNHAVAVSFTGTDATSGVASCTSGTYSGPDGSGTVAGTCTDRAGNVGSGTFALDYDSTPPQLKKVTLTPEKRAVVLKWQVSPDTQRVEINRVPGNKAAKSLLLYSGAAKAYRDAKLHVGTHYRYTLTAFDAAGNKAGQTVKVTATGALLSPAPGERVQGAIHLRWTPVRGASYYNIQLVRGGTIFSAWPTRTSLVLPRRWTYHGHAFRLRPGVYRWFVWPGFGRLKASRYGGLIGRSAFLYAR